MSEFTDFEISVDLTDTPAMAGGSFTLLPQGTYKLQAKNVEQKTAKSSGNSMINVEFHVVEVIDVVGLDDEGKTALIGQKVWNNYVLVPQSMGRLKQLMVACGATLTSFRAAEILDAVIIGEIVHSTGAAVVGQDGTPQPAKTFANVANERQVEDETPAEPVAPPPVIAKKGAKAAAAPATNGAAGRRA